jgi:hypothetical protein
MFQTPLPSSLRIKRAAFRNCFMIEFLWFLVRWQGASSGCDWREVLRLRRVAANILNKQSRTADKGEPPVSGLGVGLTTPHRKNFYCYEMFLSASNME